MKIKLGEIRNGIESLKKLLNADLPIKDSYQLSKMVKKVDREIREMEEKRNELIKKYGQVEGEGPNQKVTVKPENMESFTNDINELMEIEVELEIMPVELSKLGDLKLSAVDLINLDKFIINDLENK